VHGPLLVYDFQKILFSSEFTITSNPIPLKPPNLLPIRVPVLHQPPSGVFPKLPQISDIMSGTAQGSAGSAKPGEDKKAGGEAQKDQQQPQQPALLEEDDEFEDFPVEGTSTIPEIMG
jgi:hypothetical protein